VARFLILLAGIAIPGLLHAAPALASDEPSQTIPALLPDDPIAQHDSISLEDPLSEPVFGIGTPFSGAAVADEMMLADVTGMADLKALEQAISVRNTSTISGNIINGDPTTGTISIDGASFGGFNGLALVSANTGNNVSINAAMNVNVAIQP
jgi:hypothetical protein